MQVVVDAKRGGEGAQVAPTPAGSTSAVRHDAAGMGDQQMILARRRLMQMQMTKPRQNEVANAPAAVPTPPVVVTPIVASGKKKKGSGTGKGKGGGFSKYADRVPEAAEAGFLAQKIEQLRLELKEKRTVAQGKIKELKAGSGKNSAERKMLRELVATAIENGQVDGAVVALKKALGLS